MGRWKESVNLLAAKAEAMRPLRLSPLPRPPAPAAPLHGRDAPARLHDACLYALLLFAAASAIPAEAGPGLWSVLRLVAPEAPLLVLAAVSAIGLAFHAVAAASRTPAPQRAAQLGALLLPIAPLLLPGASPALLFAALPFVRLHERAAPRAGTPAWYWLCLACGLSVAGWLGHSAVLAALGAIPAVAAMARLHRIDARPIAANDNDTVPVPHPLLERDTAKSRAAPMTPL